jgi:NTE family protein
VPVRVGLVLGAGGIAGGAWHAGVLAALYEGTGWDARTADVVVGTSAGSFTGAFLRAGVSPPDLLAAAADGPLSEDGARLLGRLAGGTQDQIRTGGLRPIPANPLLLRSLASRAPRPRVALAGLMPAGTVDGSWIAARGEELAGGDAWPLPPLWVVAVRLSDGRRVVFGRDVLDAELGAAVAASCAIAGWYSPVEINGRRYVDGGLHSTTNADLLADAGLDLVVVSAPTAGRWRSMRANAAALARTSARVALDREVAAIRRLGTEVLVLQPGPADTPLMDRRAMDPSCRRPVAEQARTSTLELLATHPGPRPAPAAHPGAPPAADG